MGNWKWLALAVVVSGVGVTGVAKAQEPYGYGRGSAYCERQDLRQDYRRVGRLQGDIATDSWRLNRDIRTGRPWAAENQARDIARDERAVGRQYRDIGQDRRDLYWGRGYR